MTNLSIQIVNQLSCVGCSEWNALLPDDNPFLRYEFLCGLETYGCVCSELGWQPQHFIIKNELGRLIAAMPAYIKNNSFGEFVFDWPWASAYERNGLRYYPKLVAAIPFTPVTGPRILVARNTNTENIVELLTQTITEYISERSLSGFHCLFPNSTDIKRLSGHQLIKRLAYQYHWINEDYDDFDHYLSHFQSRKRKTVKQERNRINKYGIKLNILHGDELDEKQWQTIYQYYQSTFLKKGNYPALTLPFFQHLSATMGNQLVVVLAEHKGQTIAAAINLKSKDRLYGRYWGCEMQLPNLHFEVCFYMGIEYCIKHGLKVFEPGAQGEHKITRGFTPTETWSMHWIADSKFRSAIADFAAREQTALEQNKLELVKMLPFHKEQKK